MTATESSKKLSRDTQSYTNHKNLSTCSCEKVKSFPHEINLLKDYKTQHLSTESPSLYRFTLRIPITPNPFGAY